MLIILLQMFYLNYNFLQNLQTGMVIFGCIRNIKNLALEMELPGLCFALVQITDISDPFTKYLNNLLENNDSEVSFDLVKKNI